MHLLVDSAVASSAVSLLNFFASEDGVKSYMVWGMGNFGGVSMNHMLLFALLCLTGVLLSGDGMHHRRRGGLCHGWQIDQQRLPAIRTAAPHTIAAFCRNRKRTTAFVTSHVILHHYYFNKNNASEDKESVLSIGQARLIPCKIKTFLPYLEMF